MCAPGGWVVGVRGWPRSSAPHRGHRIESGESVVVVGVVAGDWEWLVERGCAGSSPGSPIGVGEDEKGSWGKTREGCGRLSLWVVGDRGSPAPCPTVGTGSSPASRGSAWLIGPHPNPLPRERGKERVAGFPGTTKTRVGNGPESGRTRGFAIRRSRFPWRWSRRLLT